MHSDYSRRQACGSSQGDKVSFVQMPLLVQELKSKGEKFRQKTLKTLMESPVLFLDGLGTEPISSWYRTSFLLPLLEYRLNRKMVTCFSAGCASDNLQKYYAGSGREKASMEAAKISEHIFALAVPVFLSPRNT